MINARIAHVTVKVRITSFKADRIFARPAAGLRIVPALEVVLQARAIIGRPAGEAEEAIDGGVRLRRQIAKGVVNTMVDDAGRTGLRVVGGQVADRT